MDRQGVETSVLSLLGSFCWIEAQPPEVAGPLYDFFVRQASTLVERVATGSFRAMMQVELVNDGPVTILLDSKKLF